MTIWRFILEARRRRVFRGAGLYIVGSWVLLQIGDVVVEPLGMPVWSMTALLYMIIICFPVALFLDWRYELREQGIVRTSRKTSAISGQDLAIGYKDYLIFSAVLAVVTAIAYSLFAGEESVLGHERDNLVLPSAHRLVMQNSIAVLPFKDMSATQDQEYFGDGLADTVLHMLTRVKSLKVAARTSSFSFKGQKKNIIDIAAELGVDHILEGSVQKAGQKLRVIAQLIDAEDGSHLWSGSFDGKLDDIFDIQDEIASKVVEAMRLVMIESDALRFEQRYKPKLAAYDQSVLGTFAMGKSTVPDLNEAAEHFRAAIELDPEYSLPYVYLAETLGLLEVYALGFQDTFSGIPTKYTREQQKPLIETALKLDPLSAEAYSAYGSIQSDEAVAEKHFLHALQLNPSYANAYLWYGKFLSIRKGQYSQALEQIEKAIQLDPLSDYVQFEHAKMVWASGQAERAMSMMVENVRRSPEFPPFYKRMVRWHSQLGDYAESARWVKELRKLDPDSPSHWGEFGGECWVLRGLADHENVAKCESEFILAHPKSITARRTAATNEHFAKHGASNDYRAVVPAVMVLYEQLVKEEPGNDYRANQYAWELENAGQYAKVLEVLQQAHPQLFIDQPQVNGETTWPASMAVNSLQKLDRNEEAEMLLNAWEQGIKGIRLIAGPGFTNGIEDVEIAALRGDTPEALRRLRRAIDKGWRFLWWALPSLKSLESINQEPEFLAMYAELEADIAAQRKRYQATKHVPLFSVTD